MCASSPPGTHLTETESTWSKELNITYKLCMVLTVDVTLPQFQFLADWLVNEMLDLGKGFVVVWNDEYFVVSSPLP